MSFCRAAVRPLTLAVLSAAFAVAPTVAHSQALTLVQTETRYAGTPTPGYNGDFGAATTVSLNGPSYIVFDSSGNQYISDTQNNCVREVSPTGSMTTLVGLATSGNDTCSTATTTTPTPVQGLYQPTGLAVDAANNLYIADSKHNCVRKLTSGATGVASLITVAGTCGDSTVPSATPSPNGLVVDSANNLYISIQDTESTPSASTYQVLRLPAATSTLCVIAGATSTLVPSYCSGITGTVNLNTPSGLAINAIGDLFIADTGNQCIRQLAGLTTLQTAAGQCTNDLSGNPLTAMGSPYGLAFSPTQTLVFSESSPNNVVSFVLGSTHFTLTAGLPNGVAGSYSPTQDGQSALNAPLTNPRGIAVDSSGNLFLADFGNSVTRKLSSNVLLPATSVGSATTPLPITFVIEQNVNLILGSSPDFRITSSSCNGSQTAATSGSSPATCQVNVSFTPTRPGLRSAPLRLTDSISGTTILQGLQATASGSFGAFTPGTVNTLAASLQVPAAIAVDSAGNSYVLETGSSAGTADLLMVPAGGGTPQVIIPQGAGLVTPSALTIDSTGNFFIADATQGTVSRFGADGTINTSYITGLDTPTALYVDRFDNLFIAQAGSAHSVIESYASGISRTISSSFVSPAGVFIDGNGILYIADAGAHFVYAVDKFGALHPIAGNGSTTDTNTGQATGTALLAPSSLAVDAAGDLYIADATANRIYTIYVSTTSNGSNISSVLGTGAAGNTGDGGPANLARIDNPVSIAIDGSNNLFLIDKGNSSARSVTFPNPTLAFGSVLVDQPSPALQQSITNFGSTNLNLSSALSISDPQFALDPASTTCGTTILPGSTCNIGVIYTPKTTGPASATLTVTSSASDSPETLNLTGTGLPIAPPALTLPPETEIYGQPFAETVTLPTTGAAPTGTITFSYGSQTLCTATGNPIPTTCNALNSGLSVGTYTITLHYSGDANYTASNYTTTLTVTPAPLTLTVNNASRTYGTPNPTFTGTLTGVAPGDNIQVAYATTATITSPIGPYPITATLTAVAPATLANYTVTNNPGTLTITAEAVVIQVNNFTRTYGAPNPTFTSTITGATGGASPTITYTTTATLTSPVGTYLITATVTGPDGQDYTFTAAAGTLTITPAPLSVVVANATRAVGDPNLAFSATITGALNGDTFTSAFSTTAVANSPAGPYPINDTVTGTNASDYTISVIPGTLTITGSSSGGGTGPGGGGTGPGGGGTGTGSTTTNTTTTISTSASPAAAGTNVTFTAVVASSAGTPTGTITFLDGTTTLGSGTLDSTGTATYSTTTLAIGSHQITASYQPNASFNASSATLTQVIAALGSFTLSAAPSTPQLIRGAGTTLFQITATSVGGFAGQITLSCSGLPADASCSFGSDPTLTAGSSVTTPLTITTAAADAALRPSVRFSPGDLAPLTAAAVFPFELTGLTVLFAGLRRNSSASSRKRRLMTLLFLTASTFGLVGCACPPTTYMTYTVTITGTSPGAASQTTTVVLSVGNN